MVVGESGLGKSTLVDSLFLTDLYDDTAIPKAVDRIHQTVEIETNTVEIEEKGIRLRLTVVDTPGFADAVDNTDCWQAVTNYVDQQYEAYLQDESGLNRRHIVDNRVHCCLYFICPHGHGLIKAHRHLIHENAAHQNKHSSCCCKADCLTKFEVQRLKRKILEEIDDNGIKIYTFPECDSEDDEEFVQINQELKGSIPFAVIGSNVITDVRGKQVRVRQYPWGMAEVENPEHCDFIKLRNMLIRTHMQDLKDVTQEVHYENYRAERLSTKGQGPPSPRKTIEAMKRKSGTFELEEEDSAVDIFEKDRMLKEKEAELRRMQEMIANMQKEMAKQKPGAVQDERL
ncbi:Septin-4 [Desmophyllum pertusum]|uniref:Septin-4 n=1 Tax=Desmophyllum pertusum TaxID=174260 RepID=A0A9W9ZW80_9CNID|nr:Septin-4 [Desmophyllum pertusum]